MSFVAVVERVYHIVITHLIELILQNNDDRRNRIGAALVTDYHQYHLRRPTREESQSQPELRLDPYRTTQSRENQPRTENPSSVMSDNRRYRNIGLTNTTLIQQSS